MEHSLIIDLQEKHDSLALFSVNTYMAQFEMDRYRKFRFPLVDFYKYSLKKSKYNSTYWLCSDEGEYNIYIDYYGKLNIIRRRFFYKSGYENEMKYHCNLDFCNMGNIRQNLNILCDCNYDSDKINDSVYALKYMCYRLFGL
jgi:hypothetical protein